MQAKGKCSGDVGHSGEIGRSIRITRRYNVRNSILSGRAIACTNIKVSSKPKGKPGYRWCCCRPVAGDLTNRCYSEVNLKYEGGDVLQGSLLFRCSKGGEGEWWTATLTDPQRVLFRLLLCRNI